MTRIILPVEIFDELFQELPGTREGAGPDEFIWYRRESGKIVTFVLDPTYEQSRRDAERATESDEPPEYTGLPKYPW